MGTGGLSVRSVALGSGVALAGMAALVQANVLSAERKYRARGTFIVVCGVRLHKIDTGGPGPTLVLLHGNGVTLADMKISGMVARAARHRRVGWPLIMAGTADKIADPHRQSARLHDTIGHSHLIWFPGLGHMLHHFVADEVVDAIEAIGKHPGLAPV